MCTRQAGESESWAHGVTNTCPNSPWCCCSFLGRRRRLQDSRGSNLPTTGGPGPAPTFGRAVPRQVTGADAQSLSLSSNHLKSAARALLSRLLCKCFISTEGCGLGRSLAPPPREGLPEPAPASSRPPRLHPRSALHRARFASELGPHHLHSAEESAPDLQKRSPRHHRSDQGT